MRLNFRKVALVCLYFYIASLYSLAYDPTLNLISKALFLITIGFFCFHLLVNPRINKGKIYIFFALYASYSLCSCFWSVDFNVAINRNLTLFQILVMVFMIYNLVENTQELENVFQSIFFGTMVMCLQTIMKYGLGNIFDMMLNGIRIGSDINQENAFGYYCVVAFLIAVYNGLYKKKRYFFALAIVPFIFSFASGSRKSILVIIAATALVFALKNGKVQISKIFVCLAICIAVFGIAYNIEALQPLFKRFTAMLDTFESVDKTGDNSIAVRMDMIKYGLRLFKNRFLFGYGTEQYIVMYKIDYGIMRPSHNNYIQSLVSFGIIGTILFYSMYVYILKIALKRVKKNDNMAVLIIIIVAVELINQFTTDIFVNKFTYIYLSLLFVYCRLATQKDEGGMAKKTPKISDEKDN